MHSYNPPILNRVSSFNARVKNAKGQRHLFVDPRKCKYIMQNVYNLRFKEGTSLIDAQTIHKLKQDRNTKFLLHIFDAISYLTEYYWPIRVER